MTDTRTMFRRLRRQLAWVAARTALMSAAIWAGMAVGAFAIAQGIPAARVEWAWAWIPVAVFTGLGFLQGLLTCVWRSRACRRRMAEEQRAEKQRHPPAA